MFLCDCLKDVDEEKPVPTIAHETAHVWLGHSSSLFHLPEDEEIWKRQEMDFDSPTRKYLKMNRLITK